MNLAKFFNQTAVYWGSPTLNAYGGYTYASPVEVKVRWSDIQEVFKTGGVSSAMRDTKNAVEEVLSKVVLLSETDFEINGRMALKTLVELGSAEDPDEEGALLIMGHAKIPTITATQFLRKTWLV